MAKSKHQFLVWSEVDLKALKRNCRAIKQLAKEQFVARSPQMKRKGKLHYKPRLLCVIKADAYGHGMIQVASALKNLGVDSFGVSDVREGVCLRKNGIKKPILLFESTLPSLAKDIIDYDLTPSVCTRSLASALNTHAKRFERKVDVHVSVDTGMGRLGVVYKDAPDFIRYLMRLKNLSIKGIYTHFPVADINQALTTNQISQLYDLVKGLDKHALIVPYIHAANSMGLAGYKTRILNLSRPGLMLYGLYPAPSLRRKIKLEPVMSVKTRIIFLKTVDQGAGISYGHTFIAPREMTVATLPIGYNDGYFRCFSNKAAVLIEGKRCPIVGRVTMDQTMVDVSHLKKVSLGSEAVILGTQGSQKISADELARYADTIHYEIICSFGNRLPRIYK